jgi:hypothetical protein
MQVNKENKAVSSKGFTCMVKRLTRSYKERPSKIKTTSKK